MKGVLFEAKINWGVKFL